MCNSSPGRAFAALILVATSAPNIVARERLAIETRPFPLDSPTATLDIFSTTRSGSIQGFVLAIEYDDADVVLRNIEPAGSWLDEGPADFLVPYGTSTHPGEPGQAALMVLIDLSEDARHVIPAHPAGEPQLIARLFFEKRASPAGAEPDIDEPDAAEGGASVDAAVHLVDDLVELRPDTMTLTNHIVIDGLDYFAGGDDTFQLDLVPGGFQSTPELTIEFQRGDADGSGDMTLTDPIRIFGYLFQGGSIIDCADAADVNDDGTIDISDGIFGLTFLFVGGTPPPPPGYRTCGSDPSVDRLGDCNYPLSSCP